EMERGSAAGSPVPDRPTDAQPETRIKAQPASTKQKRPAIFCPGAGSRGETRGRPSRDSALWFNLQSRPFGKIDVPMNASKLAENLTRLGSCNCLWIDPFVAVKHVRNAAGYNLASPRQYGAATGTPSRHHEQPDIIFRTR